MPFLEKGTIMQLKNSSVNENGDVFDNPPTETVFNVVANSSTFSAIKKHKLKYNSPNVSSTLISGILPLDVATEWKGEALMGIHHLSTLETKSLTHNYRADRNTVEQSEQASLIQKTPSFKMFRDNVFIYPIDNEALIYNPAVQTLHHLNETAYYVWSHYDSQSAEDFANAFAHKYNVEIHTAIDHIIKVIKLFRNRSLLTMEPLDESYE